MSEPLDIAVKDLLVKHKGHWQTVVDEAKVSHSWLSKFVNGHIPNPGYPQLKRVHDCLKRLTKKVAA
jgi:hypothetical protein